LPQDSLPGVARAFTPDLVISDAGVLTYRPADALRASAFVNVSGLLLFLSHEHLLRLEELAASSSS